MGLINCKKLFEIATERRCAIGGFNVNNMETIQAITEAAKETNSPVILQVSVGARKYAGHAYLLKLVETAVSKTDLPIVLHLDHGESFEICKDCIDGGFTSVMIDGSRLNFDENVELTKKVVDYAHKHNVSVESELGRLINNDENNIYTNPQESKKFVELTKVDSLAVAIGTCHGAFKSANSSKNGQLNFEVLKQIAEALPNFPIVLHGASSINLKICEKINTYGGFLKNTNGIEEKVIQKAIKIAVRKVNIDSDLRLATTASIREYLFKFPEQFDPRTYLAKARNAVKKLVKHKIENVLGSKNLKLNQEQN